MNKVNERVPQFLFFSLFFLPFLFFASFIPFFQPLPFPFSFSSFSSFLLFSPLFSSFLLFSFKHCWLEFLNYDISGCILSFLLPLSTFDFPQTPQLLIAEQSILFLFFLNNPVFPSLSDNHSFLSFFARSVQDVFLTSFLP